MILKPPALFYDGFDTEALTLFVAGGISECQDWQSEFTESLEDLERIVMFNPRRDNFDLTNQAMANEQIAWEYFHLKYAAGVSFWFPDHTIAPITLFELGKELGRRDKAIFVGIGPSYHRRFDVEQQVRLAEMNIQIVYSLKDLAAQVRNWVEA